MRLGLLLVFAACGRVGFTPLDDGRVVDVSGDVLVTPRCAMWSAWSAPVLVPAFNTANEEYGPSLTSDGLVACFTSDRAGGAGNYDVYCSERASTADVFGPALNVGLPNTSANERNVAVSPDGLELLLTSVRGDSVGGRDIYQATRASRADAFGPAVHVSALATIHDDEPSAISADGLRLYFSRVDDPDQAELFVASRPSPAAAFDTFVQLDEINVGADDDQPVPRPDELEIVWGSTRSGGLGGRDLWRATRSDPTAAFGAAEHIPELASALDDLPATLSADGAEIYLNFNMELSTGGPQSDVWRATRTCLD